MTQHKRGKERWEKGRKKKGEKKKRWERKGEKKKRGKETREDSRHGKLTAAWPHFLSCARRSARQARLADEPLALVAAKKKKKKKQQREGEKKGGKKGGKKEWRWSVRAISPQQNIRHAREPDQLYIQENQTQILAHIGAPSRAHVGDGRRRTERENGAHGCETFPNTLVR